MIDEHWAARIAELLRAAPRLLATSVFELIRAEGYTGSYVSVARHLNELRGPRFTAAPAASTRIVTAPGEECQFDWSDVSHWTREWGLGEVQCFSAILSLVEGADLVVRPLHRPGVHLRGPGPVLRVRRRRPQGAAHRPHGGTRASPRAGGSRSTRRRHGFAQFHGTEIRACQARDAKRKGKVERPFRDVKERFLEECSAPPGRRRAWPSSTSGRPAGSSSRIHGRLHRGIGDDPGRAIRHRSARCSAPLPRRRFDTAYVEARRVHVAIPQIEWRGVRYSVPPRCLGQTRRGAPRGGRVHHRDPLGRRGGGHPHRRRHRRHGEVWDAAALASRPAGRPRSRSRGRHLVGRAPRRRTGRTFPLRLDIDRRRGRRRSPTSPAMRPRGRVVTNSLYEQLKDDLGYLGLTRSAECFATLAEEAKTEEWSHIEFLARVIGEQANGHGQSKAGRPAALRPVPVPARRCPTSTSSSSPASTASSSTTWPRCGSSRRTGRSCSSASPGAARPTWPWPWPPPPSRPGYRGYFTTADDMVNTLVQAKREGTLATKLKTLTAPSVLVIDDVGLLPIERGGAGVFFHVVNTRYERGHPTLITTNRGLPEWGEIFGDPVVAAAILDRLMHNAVVFNIKGPSWRMREHHALETGHHRARSGLRKEAPLTFPLEEPGSAQRGIRLIAKREIH